MCLIDIGSFTPFMKVIVTSFLFPGGVFALERLQKLYKLAGKDSLVVDVRLVQNSFTARCSVFKSL